MTTDNAVAAREASTSPPARAQQPAPARPVATVAGATEVSAARTQEIARELVAQADRRAVESTQAAAPQAASAQHAAAARQAASAQQAAAQRHAELLRRSRAQAVPPSPATARTEQVDTRAGLPPRSGAGAEASAEPPLLRVVCWQLALVLGLLAVGRPWPVTAALCGAGVLVVVLTSVRRRGTWLTGLVARAAGLLARRRTGELPASGDTSQALLGMVAPDVDVCAAQVAGGSAGLVCHAGDMAVALRPQRAAPAPFAAAALSDWLLPAADPAMPGLRAQLVLHHGPQCARAQRAWIALRAVRDVDSGDEDLRTALGNTVRRMQRRMRRAGLDGRLLPEQEVRATVTALTHAAPCRGAVTETWRCWRTGDVTQVALRVRGVGSWTGEHRLPVLERLLAAVPGVACTLAVSVSDPRCDAIMRVASSTATAVDAAAERLARLAPVLGVRVERLDGLHARAAAASLPIGGNLP